MQRKGSITHHNVQAAVKPAATRISQVCTIKTRTQTVKSELLGKQLDYLLPNNESCRKINFVSFICRQFLY